VIKIKQINLNEIYKSERINAYESTQKKQITGNVKIEMDDLIKINGLHFNYNDTIEIGLNQLPKNIQNEIKDLNIKLKKYFINEIEGENNEI
jgi:hypothetical protein